MARLRANEDFRTFWGYLQRARENLVNDLVDQPGDVPLRWMQGQAQALGELSETVVRASQTIAKRKAHT